MKIGKVNLVGVKHWAFLILAFISVSCDSQKPADVDAETAVEQDSLGPIQQLDLQLREDPQNSQLYASRSKLYLDSNEYIQALKDIERALAIDSLDADLYIQKADILFKSNLHKRAKSTLEYAQTISPDHVAVNLELSRFELLLNNFEAAIGYADNIIRVDVNNDEAYFAKGLAFKYAGDTARALSSFLTAAEQNPDNYDAWMELGIFHSAINDDAAIQYFSNAIDSRLDSTDAYYAMAYYQQNHNYVEAALETYKTMRTKAPQSPLTYFGVGFLMLTIEQNFDSALIEFNRAIALNPDYTQAIYNRGLTYEQLKDATKAVKDYRRALEIDPQFTLAAQGLSRIGT